MHWAHGRGLKRLATQRGVLAPEWSLPNRSICPGELRDRACGALLQPACCLVQVALAVLRFDREDDALVMVNSTS
jgi:hypothetical protein